jgi:hypothetical protein
MPIAPGLAAFAGGLCVTPNADRPTRSTRRFAAIRNVIAAASRMYAERIESRALFPRKRRESTHRRRKRHARTTSVFDNRLIGRGRT